LDRPINPKDGQSRMLPRTPDNGDGRRRGIKAERGFTLDPEQSAALREKLLMEVGNIPSGDVATGWAREALTAKNRLTASDAKLVEDAFEQTLELPRPEPAAVPNDESPVPQIPALQVNATTEISEPAQAHSIDKSNLTISTPRRYRNREHLRYVAQQACLVC